MAGLSRRGVLAGGGSDREELDLELGSLAVDLNAMALSLMEEAGERDDKPNVVGDMDDVVKQVKQVEQLDQEVPAVAGAIDAVRALVRRLEAEQRDFNESERRHRRVCRELAEEASRIEKEVEGLSEAGR